jgi:FAD/FMN-containing dehydrogenase
MRKVTVDATQRLARVEAGALWGDVVGPAAEHGLAGLAGSSPDVGVVGLTLGGGISWLSRRFGLTASSMVAAEVVTADGRMSRVDEQREPELFWALRGGGGSFAAVTAMELRLYSVPELTAGALFWPLERAGEVLEAWRRWLPSLPDELTSCWHLLQFPPIPEVPEPMRGRSFVVLEVAHLGRLDEINEMLVPFRTLGPELDTVAQATPNDLLILHMDPPTPVPSVGDGVLLSSLSESALDELLRVVGPGSGSPLVTVELRHLGGALSRPSPSGGAVNSLDAEFSFFAAGFVPDETAARFAGERVQDAKLALADCQSAQDYLNFRESADDAARFFPPEVLDHLRRVKQIYDPTNVFLANHPVTRESAS